MMGFSVYNLLEKDDNDALKSELANCDLLLKFPLTLPYLGEWESSMPSNEELLKGNEYYKIVSKQIVNDTLYVQCEFSQTSRERFWCMVSTFEDHAKTNSDSHKGATGTILKNFLKEYMAIGRKHTFYIFEWSTPVTFDYTPYCPVIPESSIPSPPPDLLS
ncbi:hypothetical protein ACFP1I_27225 [Dyadobacter subterraneus]|uniref:Uncharacterized protein n=1 Tax=Dyadobacter subterraneus TaxID=2773304 RepID=A0ABR9WFX6_9BACT|nr:hypothetical protein [Dyadobacter subterraneus]MBE9463054.1 hypothetical protein [Dyadobacter subterraneus]